jgi:pyruvate,water dikinase
LTGLDNVAIKRDLFLEEIAQGIVKELGDENDDMKSFEELMTILPQTENGRMLSSRLESFQRRFGYVWADRYPRDPGWEFSKQKLVLSLKEFGKIGKQQTLQKKTEELRSQRSKTVIQFEEQLCMTMLSGVKIRIWRSLLKDVETFFPYKEQRNDYLYNVIMAVRSLGREIGKRSVAEGIIEKPSDIFFLTAEEIITKDKVDGSPYWLKNLIERRKLNYEQSLKSVEFGKSVIDRDSYSSINQGKKKLFGDGCSPGFGMGIARVINGMSELDRIRDGEILLCSSFRPAMSPVLSRIGGLIVERGSVISHGAILSREYGVPAVFNIKNITRLVADGDEVSLDGNTGIIKLN